MGKYQTYVKEHDCGNKIAEFEMIQQICHGVAKEAGWWTDLETGEFKDRSDLELLALVHSEISEAVEGSRKDLMDDHLPQFKMVEVELADAIIRILDMAGAKQYRVALALFAKLRYNVDRADHKIENRKKEGGKKS